MSLMGKGPMGLKEPKAEKVKVRKPIRPRSKKKQAERLSDKGQAGLAHMAKVAAMPCVICWEWSMKQLSETKVHHCIHGRFSAKKAPDTATLPLCDGHHQGEFDGSKIALHREPDEWKRRYGEDTHWLNWVTARLEGE